jgi:Reverse transcriptase (RNA-dependent DNA polymerase)
MIKVKKKFIVNIKVFKSYNEISNMKSAKFSNEVKSSIFDTGASRSGTSDSKILTNLEKCEKVSVQGAFGPPCIPSLKGKLGPLELETLVIPGMNETLLSVYQICNGGSKDFQCIALFTTEGCRIFKLDSVRQAIKDMHDNGIEIMRGLVHQGLYHEDKSFIPTKSLRMLMASTKSPSKYDQVHLVLGHPGKKGMEWHRKNTLNAHYTQEDAELIRPVCEGCVYGGMRQTSTDHLKEHRQNPTRPGQIFVMDAYTSQHKSFRGMFYADIFRDIATHMIYVIYTKNRSAPELVEQMTKELDKHPEWAVNLDITQRRFFRVDAESNYRSQEFASFLADRFYKLEKTPSRDKHAGGIAERTVGILSLKTNIAMISPIPNVPDKYWELAMTYAAETLGFNFSEAIGTSPYYYITGTKANVKYLHPFWSKCYVYIPLELRKGKIGTKRAHKARFVGYNNSTILFPNYIVMEINDNGTYGKVKSSKDVIFDNSIEYSRHKEDEEPYDREFNNPDSYIPYAMRMNVPDKFKGPNAIIPKVDEVIEINTPSRTVDKSLAERNVLRNKNKNNTKNNANSNPQRDNNKSNNKETTTNLVNNNDLDDYGEKNPHNSSKVDVQNNSENSNNNENNNYDKNTNTEMTYDNKDLAVYWYNFHIKNDTYPIIMCETQHKMFALTPVRDPNCPRTFDQAMRIPCWAEAIDKELTKFEINSCLTYVEYNGQHLVPMMWLFSIKTDGTHKARLVGRGDLMKAYIDFDPDAVYCGNVSSCSIKMCIAIAAKYKLEMRGGDLEGAYLVTRANKDYPVYIRTPQGYTIPNGMCMQAVGNLYGFPPAGQNFSIEFDKCVKECGFKNTAWDLKFFYKWVDGRPILLIAHSDDFRVFCDKRDMSEWDNLVKNFNTHKYKVTDASDKEFVGIRITRDEEYNYFMDQTRMINDILKELNVTGAKGEKLPYPVSLPNLSKQDNATDSERESCQEYPYRRVVGQLMYGMVHTMVTIMYALNVLSRYSNNPGPRHIEFIKHLVRFVKHSKEDRLIFRTSDGPYDIDSMTKVLQLRFQCDADLAGNKDNMHSQTSFLGYLGGALICWCSTDQGSVATSTAESEIKAVNHALKAEIIANRGILTTMGWKQETTIIEEDNKACVDASKILQMTRGLRHLDISESWFKEKVADGTCEIIKIDSAQNNSDIGTKRVPQKTFDYLTNSILDRNNSK